MNDKVVIAGTVKLRNTIKAKTNLHNVINGTPSWVVNTGGGGIVYPHYTGSYTVTPSASVQTLDTSDKVMDDDVTVQAVPQGSATTPATIITTNPTISVSSGGLITSIVSKTQQITPTVVEGYVSAGTAGNVGVSGSATEMLDTQAAQTIHPASTDQTIASGKYLTGAQTFKAVTVTGLTADKVLQGNVIKIGDADDDDRIMSVTGTASGGITPTGTKQITANGTSIDVYNYQYADVAVPNSYSASDEGKVVSNGALVAQTSDTVTENGVVDTTLIDELTVNVSGGGGSSVFANLYELTLTDAVRSVQIDFQSSWYNYDHIFVFVVGSFTSSDWLYWNLNSTVLDNNKYSKQTATLSTCYHIAYMPESSTSKVCVAYKNNNGYIAANNSLGLSSMSDVNYFWLSGYSKDMTAGTKIAVYGVKYADI